MCLDDHELTAVQYARLHGIALDHQNDLLPMSHVEALREDVPETLTEETGLPNLDLHTHISTQETLTLDKGAAELLNGASNGLSTSKELDSILFPLLDSRQVKKLRLETPLLRTDHASDFRAFAMWEESHIKDGCLPMEPLDDEMDMSLEWPQALKLTPAELLKELESEKIQMMKETFIYLQATIKGTWTEEDDKKISESTTYYKRKAELEPATPPLLPLSPPSTPYVPSSPACHLPLLSDPASLMSGDLRDAENAIFEQDSLIQPTEYGSPLTDSSATIASNVNVRPYDVFFQGSLEIDELPLCLTQIKAEDRKVDVPLMPATPPIAIPKTVKFKEIIEEMLLDPFCKKDGSDSPVSGREEVNKYFREAFGDAADIANRRVEQEQLQEADAECRVPVPIMDFKLPNPPWKSIDPTKSVNRSVSIMKDIRRSLEEYERLPSWPGINRLVPKLRWTVFPSELAKVALDENFGDDGVLDTFLNPSRNERLVDSDILTWKPPGFRVLKDGEEDDEDDLEVGLFGIEKIQDVEALVRKRRMQYEEENSNSHTSAKRLDSRPSAGGFIAHSTTQEHQQNENQIRDGDPRDNGISALVREHREGTTQFLDGPFSASDALENFLEIRTSKKLNPTCSGYFVTSSAIIQSSKSLPKDISEGQAQITEPKRTPKSLPTPLGDLSSRPSTYIISSAVLKHRLLVRTLNAIFPAAVQIERDFTAHNSTAWLPNSITRSPVISSLDSEADFIISPSTGIIITTLQKIKQKPLPGQKSKSAIKERIERVCARYERLVVLVSEACAGESTNGLVETDVLALAEATGFCGSLNTSVILQFVGGGDETLAKWLAAFIVRYGSQAESGLQLLEDETLWELFLRRAGMNAYAAQAVIAELKAPDGVHVSGGSKAGLFGITAFVEMGQEERVARFEQILGGRRVLQRVGRVLDASWS